MSMTVNKASFRDPDGTVLEAGEEIVRILRERYKEHWQKFNESGLADILIKKNWLLPFCEKKGQGADEYARLHVTRLPFLTYPAEWCFAQLKAAALLTLDIQRYALRHGMTLKDASAFNVQFIGKRPVFIDHSSFLIRSEGQAWVGYRQFCEHFLAPLLVASHCDGRVLKTQSAWLDGMPLELASKLLPWTTWLSPKTLIHLHLHAWMQGENGNNQKKARAVHVTQASQERLLENLRQLVAGLKPHFATSSWSDYVSVNLYEEEETNKKRIWIEDSVKKIAPSRIIDLGANSGYFSQAVAPYAELVVSADFDQAAVNYMFSNKSEHFNILPMVLDLTNPTPGVGWANQERTSFGKRADFDLALMLAVIHHLAVSENIPLDYIAEWLAGFSRYAIVEFVQPTDRQVQRLTALRDDNWQTRYNLDNFLSAFSEYFSIENFAEVTKEKRTLFLMKRKY